MVLSLAQGALGDGGSGGDAGEDQGSAVRVASSFQGNITDPDVDLYLLAADNETVYVRTSGNNSSLQLGLELLNEDDEVLSSSNESGSDQIAVAVIQGSQDVQIRLAGSGASSLYTVFVDRGPMQDDAGTGQDISHRPAEAMAFTDNFSATIFPEDPGDAYSLPPGEGVQQVNVSGVQEGTVVNATVINASDGEILTYATVTDNESMAFLSHNDTEAVLIVSHVMGPGGEYNISLEELGQSEDAGAGRDAGITTGDAIRITETGTYVGFLEGSGLEDDWADLYRFDVIVEDSLSVRLTPADAFRNEVVVSIQTEPEGASRLEIAELARWDGEALVVNYTAGFADERIYLAVSNELGGAGGFYTMEIVLNQGDLAFGDIAFLMGLCCCLPMVFLVAFILFIRSTRRSAASGAMYQQPYLGEPGRGFVGQPGFNTAFPQPGVVMVPMSQPAPAAVPVASPEVSSGDDGFRPLSEIARDD